MSLVVMKFGGTSVANRERIYHVAEIIRACKSAGNDVVVVVSAQGDTTDRLIDNAREISDRPPKREMDALLSAGEQMSAALLAMALDHLGLSAVSLTGYQAGFITSSRHSDARIRRINTERVENELDNNKIVIITGFQGINRKDDITTLGRGGSDTSAVAIAAALHADICRIYTDVDGVYTADPRIVQHAVKLEEISFEEMMELSSQGAKVLQNRSVELAQKYNVKLEVLSSMTGNAGTVIKEVANMEGLIIKGVTKDTNFVSISVFNIEDKPGIAFKLFELLGREDIKVDIILQSVEREGKRDIVFTIRAQDEETTLRVLRESQQQLGFSEVIANGDIAKVSAVGSGMMSHSGIVSRLFGSLYDAGININMITTSEIKISVIVDSKDADRAVEAIHDEFFRDEK